MRLLFIFAALIIAVNAGFFDFLTGKGETVTHKDVEPTQVTNANLGREIELDGEHVRDRNKDGDVIDIPHNTNTNPLNDRLQADEPQRQRPIPTAVQPSQPKVLPDQKVTAPIANADRCPTQIDAYTESATNPMIFAGTHVYSLQGNRIISANMISQLFPKGPMTVTAAVYDLEREILVLLHERTVYGYKKNPSSNVYDLISVYPKELPSSIPFVPTAAVRWHDKHQILTSDDGRFAMYDEYWNKSLLTAKTETYFKGLPQNVRGISDWSNGRADVFTSDLVFIYDQKSERTVENGVALSRFLRC